MLYSKGTVERQVWRASRRTPQLKLKAVFVVRNKVFTILGFLIQTSICFSPKFFWSLARSRIFQMPLYQKMLVCSFLCRNLESVRPAPPSRETEMTLPAPRHSSYFKLFTILFLRPKSNDSPLGSHPQPPSSELITPFLCFPNTSQPWRFKGFFYPAIVRFSHTTMPLTILWAFVHKLYLPSYSLMLFLGGGRLWLLIFVSPSQ